MTERMVYICPRCGSAIIETPECTFCGCTMIKTQYTEDDWVDAEDFDRFWKKLLNEFVYGNPLYSDAEYQRRLKQEDEEFYSSSSPVPRCPNCGSTAITTGQRGYSVIYGFAGSSRTVNRCGNCGYKWEP